MNEKEKSKEKSYEVWHMITPHKYFEEKVQDKPIFALEDDSAIVFTDGV